MSSISWGAVLRRTVAEFKDDELADRAAALTYYGTLALLPALLVLVSLLGIAGKSATKSILDNLTKLTPGSARDIITNVVTPTPPEQWGLGSVMQGDHVCRDMPVVVAGRGPVTRAQQPEGARA
jgi:membrane protein